MAQKVRHLLWTASEMELKMKKLFYGFSFLFDDAGIRRFITILRTEPLLGFTSLMFKFFCSSYLICERCISIIKKLPANLTYALKFQKSKIYKGKSVADFLDGPPKINCGTSSFC